MIASISRSSACGGGSSTAVDVLFDSVRLRRSLLFFSARRRLLHRIRRRLCQCHRLLRECGDMCLDLHETRDHALVDGVLDAQLLLERDTPRTLRHQVRQQR